MVRIIALVIHIKQTRLRFSDVNWHRITNEQEGLDIINCIRETQVCDLTASGTDGFTLLHLAAQKGYLLMIERLLAEDFCPDINLCDKDNFTPVYYAIKMNRCVSVKFTIGFGITEIFPSLL